jgi:hypothetical protein
MAQFSVGIFYPLNPDEGFVDTDFGFPTPWSPDTNMGGGFQPSAKLAVTAPPTQWNDSNMIWDPAPSAASTNGSNLSPDSSLTTSISAPPLPTPPLAAPASTPLGPNARHQCTYPRCTKTFKRDYERIRYEASLHCTNRR